MERDCMQIKAKINPSYEKMEIHVCYKEANKSVANMVQEISRFIHGNIPGTDERGDKVLIPLRDIARIYAFNQKVYAEDSKGTYALHQKLYELEESLDENEFIRISKSEIVNLKQIKKIDMNAMGTIKVILLNGTQTYTSRRNVTRLKKVLGIGGNAI